MTRYLWGGMTTLPYARCVALGRAGPNALGCSPILAADERTSSGPGKGKKSKYCTSLFPPQTRSRASQYREDFGAMHGFLRVKIIDDSRLVLKYARSVTS